MLVAVPGPAVTDALQAAGPLDGRVMIDAANSFGQQQVTLRSLADAFPRARWVRAFNSLSASIMADDNHREPPWVMFLSGDEEAKPVVAQLIRDAGFDPADLGGIDDSRLQDPDSALWLNILTHDEATALVAQVKSGDTDAAEQSALRTRVRELAAPFEKLRDHAPDDPAFFLEHLSRSVFEAGISWRVVEAKWDGIREAFHGFDPAQVAAMPPAEIAAVEKRQPRDPQQGEDPGDGAERAGSPRHPRRVRQHPGLSRVLAGRGRCGRGHAAAFQVPRRHGRVAAADQRVARHRVTQVTAAERPRPSLAAELPRDPWVRLLDPFARGSDGE